MTKNSIERLSNGNVAVTIEGVTLVLQWSAVATVSATENVSNAEAGEAELTALRGRIRAWMDLLERSAHNNKALRITPKECADLDLVFRQIQDVGAKALGYE